MAENKCCSDPIAHFFLHASEEERGEVYIKAAKEADEEQMGIIKQYERLKNKHGKLAS